MQEYFYNEKGIYYRTNNFDPNKLTLVFIHGVTSSSSAWFEFEDIFKDKYNILTYDLRGHGKSVKFPKYSDYDIENFSKDLFDLVNYLNIKKFVLISHSFGTYVARDFLMKYQDMLSGIVFLSPGMSVANTFSAKIIRALLGLAKILQLFPQRNHNSGHVNYIDYKGSGDYGIRRVWADLRITGLRVFLFSLRRIYFFNEDGFLEKIYIPTLIVHGKKDTYIPIKNTIDSSKIKDSEFVIIENADHVIVLNNVEEVSQAISNFIDKIK